MEKYVELFKYIKEQTGKGSKERKIEMFKKLKDDKLLFEMLSMAFNDEVKTGLGKAKVNKKVKVAPNIIIKNMAELMHYVEAHATGTDQDIANVQYFLNTLEEDEKELVVSIITKQLKIGISRELNDVFDKPIVVIPIAQKGENAKDHKAFFIGKKLYISEKLDGQRGTYEKGSLNSYNRIEYKFLNDLTKEIQDKLPKGYVFDGELLYKPKANEKLDRKEIRSRTATILNSDSEDKKDIEFVIFDIVKEDKWAKEVDTISFEERRNLLEKIFKDLDLKWLRLVKIYSIQTGLDNIQHWLQLSKEEGLEGVIINIANAPYEYKRSKNIFKLKDQDTIDLRIIDLEEGQGDFVGMLGAFIVDYKGNRVHVGGGRGLDHELRTKIWNERITPNSVIGKILEVSYFGESKDSKTGLNSLTSPQYVVIRTDKDTSDTE